MTRILQTVLRIFKHYKLLSANQTLIIGVSGGTDSLALLHILHQLRLELAIDLHVATLDHHIRGADGAADVEFVKRTAEQIALPYTAGHIDVPHLAADLSIGIEAAARRARYDFLAEVARQQNAQVVAVAHHADDQAETILMHMIRGSGLKGLRGMAVLSSMPEHPDIQLLRPLLSISRQELEQYCIEHDLSPRHDATNDDSNYQRNFVRHELLAKMKTVNPNIVAAFIRLAETATIDDDFIDSQFKADVMPYIVKDARRWAYDIKRFNRLHDALQRRYILYAFKHLSTMSESLSSQHVQMVLALLDEGRVNTKLDLGDGIRVRIEYETFFVEAVDEPLTDETYRLIPENTFVVLSVPFLYTHYGLHIHVSSQELSEKSLGKPIILPETVELVLRSRKAGDRFKPVGMGGHSRKVKNWMIDKKIPQRLRDRIPLITVNDEVIAIYIENQWHLADLSQYIVNENRSLYLILG